MAAVAPHREQKGSAELHSGDRQSPRGQHGAADWGGGLGKCVHTCAWILPLPPKKKKKDIRMAFNLRTFMLAVNNTNQSDKIRADFLACWRKTPWCSSHTYARTYLQRNISVHPPCRDRAQPLTSGLCSEKALGQNCAQEHTEISLMHSPTQACDLALLSLPTYM